ncbi:MAG: endolytic transglycosylase MltG, partial [Salaquimonas sp.]
MSDQDRTNGHTGIGADTAQQQPSGSIFGRRSEVPQSDMPPPPAYTSDDYIARSPQDVLQPRDVPPPPKRSKQARNKFVVFMNFCLSSLVLLALGIGAAFYFGKTQFEASGPLQKAKTIVIEEGSGLQAITSKLETSGIISSGFIFNKGVIASQNASSLKAGEYAFKPGMSMQDVMDTIVSGKGIVHKVAIPEGLTSIQIMKRIAENEVLEGEIPTEVPAEGSIMPDTYPFQRGTTRKELLDQMRRQQELFLAQIWEKRIDGLPLKSPEEMVILASIVEKETAKADERPRVASVFINRLNQGMRLQSDPTIIYGIFGGAGKPSDRPI